MRTLATRTDGPVAEPGERLDVVYDPTGRLDTRPAEPGGPSFSWLGSGLFILAVALPLLRETEIPPFGGAVDEEDRSWRKLWGLRRFRI